MTVPVVDLSRFRHGTSRDKWSVAAEFDRACRDIGFLVVSGHWVAAPARCNTFVVNIGDLMMRWTNDRWTSTPHRVAVPPADLRHVSRRLSIAYFVRPNFDAPIACIPTCARADNPPRYEATTLQDYAVARFAAGAGPQPTEDESIQRGS